MKKSQINELINMLRNTYPDAKCSLNFKTPFELVVAVCLSAQCTDERVNSITPHLFEICKTINDFANIDLNTLEEIILPCGFYKNKAKNIKNCAKQIIDKYNGIVPCNINDLISLSGVGRKSANVIMLEAFGIAHGIAVDTHCKRISNRIGLSKEKEPSKIELDLLEQINPSDYKDVNHLFIWHGRNTCKARNPLCEKCSIKHLCENYNVLFCSKRS